MTTSGEPQPARGEIWWVRLDKRRPVVVVQNESIRDPRVRSFLVVPLTSRLHLANLPGNFPLSKRATGLAKDSVANVYDLQKALRPDFLERAGILPGSSLDRLEQGLRLVLRL